MKPDSIIIHHSLTKDGETVSWGAIRDWHRGIHPLSPYRQSPMVDIGYHFGIELVNARHEILAGRMLNEMGAHCKGHNESSIGICFVGNFDEKDPCVEQWRLGLRLVQALMDVLGIPKSRVYPHRRFAPDRSCPGWQFNFSRFLDSLKGERS